MSRTVEEGNENGMEQKYIFSEVHPCVNKNHITHRKIKVIPNFVVPRIPCSTTLKPLKAMKILGKRILFSALSVSL